MGQIHTAAQLVCRIEESLSMGCCQITESLTMDSHGSNSHSSSVSMTDRGIPLNGLLSWISHGSNSHSSVGMTDESLSMGCCQITIQKA